MFLKKERAQGQDDEEMKARGTGEKTASRCYSWEVQQCQDYDKRFTKPHRCHL